MIRAPIATTLAALCLALAALWPALAAAEQADRDKPLNIESDSLRYDDKTQTSVFTGNVVVTKGTILMRGARLQVHQDAQGFRFGTMQAAPGQRAFFHQKREGLDEYIEGQSETIEYDEKADTVRLLRNAQMRRLAGNVPQDEVYGSVIVYNDTTEVYTVEGAQTSGMPSSDPSKRVRVILAPRNTGRPPAAAAPRTGRTARAASAAPAASAAVPASAASAPMAPLQSSSTLDMGAGAVK